MSIRKATLRDIDSLMELLYQVHNYHKNYRPDIFKAFKTKYNREELEKLLFNSNYKVYVYELENKVVGHIFCIIEELKDNPSLHDRKILFIDDLCVDENLRSRGIGKELCDYALKLSKELNCDSVELNVWNFNDKSLNFYKKLGYTELKTRMELRKE